MNPRRIGVEAAREYWADASQLEDGITPDMIQGDGVQFWACGPICGGFRRGPWPGVLMADYGVKPEGWGRLAEPARAILDAVWREYKPNAIAGWTDSRKRAALAFSKRIGFRRCGEMALEDGATIIMQEWRPLWA
jgi:hypothetical protein